MRVFENERVSANIVPTDTYFHRMSEWLKWSDKVVNKMNVYITRIELNVHKNK